MAGKDGYQQYLDQAAAAANAVGGSHHDPAVRARQGMLAGGIQPAAPKRRNGTLAPGTTGSVQSARSRDVAPSSGIGHARAAEMRAHSEGILQAARMLVAAHRKHLATARALGDVMPAQRGTREAELEGNADYRDWVWETWFDEVSPIQAAVGQHGPEVGFTHFLRNSNGFTRSRDMTSAEVLEYLEERVGDRVDGLAEALRDLRIGSAVKHLERLIRTQHASYPGQGNWARTPTRREILAARQAETFKVQRAAIARQKAEEVDRERFVKVFLATLGALAILFAVLAIHAA